MLNLIPLNLLALHEFHPGFIHFAYKFAKSTELVVLTSQSNDKHACGIWMMNHVSKNPAGIFMVVTEL